MDETNSVQRQQSTEGETLQAITRICQKCELGGKPHKFPKPDKALHAILVDMRTFKNGGDVHDRVHIGLGGEYVKEPYRVYWGQGKERKLISGVFGPATDLKGAIEARERVHFIGFVRERSFQSGELGPLIQFVANPHLLKDATAIKTAIDTWPLLPTQVLNATYRQYFSRTLATIEPDAIWPGMWRIRDMVSCSIFLASPGIFCSADEPKRHNTVCSTMPPEPATSHVPTSRCRASCPTATGVPQ